MCGIVGIINFDRNNVVSLEKLTSVTQVLSHRGPDDEGIWCHKNYGLGFRRLSIVDLSPAGNQPFVNETGDIRLLCNGEIYNYQSLRQELIDRGHVFSSHSDSETALHAYEEYGERFFDYLNGMFAIAVLDQRKRKLILGRDRLGIKPLYYKVDHLGIRFGSELKAVVADTSLECEIDPLALNLYFIREVIPAPYSIYKGIKKLCPGECLIADLENGERGVHLKKYWRLKFEPDRKTSEQSWKEQLSYLLEDAVKTHMLSDVPLGAFLSGGIDSSSVVALMSQVSSSPVETFTIGFNDKEADESFIAREVANYCGTRHHELTVEADSLKILDRLIWHYDEPFGDSSAIPTYFVSEMARKFVTVVLSGDGGDELFGGYFSQQAVKRIRWSCKFPSFLRFIIPAFSRFLNTNGQSIKRLGLPRWLMLASLHAHIFDEIRHNVLQPEWRVSWDTLLATYDHLKDDLIELEPMNACLAAYFGTYLPDDILTKVDRASSAHSLETRVPLLDYRIAELVAKIPPELKFQGTNQKYIFRETIGSLLPKNVFDHPKHGFSVPIKKWGPTIWLKKLGELRSEFPDVDRIINFSQMNQWDAALVWQVLFFANWIISDKRRLV